ncbi:aminotransferase class I/II-fold pyridoxal phosphate-dependent enzyme [Streptomyces qinzhouensis]|uniref:Aminotransferase class I/II-fold pyridoxal phosphate-dependent enzyme n=1 Tax=Streptomyces qinzhouensis TaxID=2599401 RepID=A0A5B8JQ52_9ACTN|nr:aminotransferase class I/II-fold pyridoxal phosphate-dependent enzyme [Streptomyces qinzhouensis]QDY79843.1 aminotransferase class I/II-fold pyridoxal phosphate-dependent enzyme [Streptomyces qinzhouensis]
MDRSPPDDPGTVRHDPRAPESGLPVLPELRAVAAGAADRAIAGPPGGPAPLRDAAAGYWTRRGLRTTATDSVAAHGTPALLCALIAAHDGDVLMPRPSPAWWTPQARLLRRAAYHVPTSAESGGVPDPYALLEAVRRVRAEGGTPKLLLLSVADDPTASVAPPELVREACEAAIAEGLHIVSDETWRDTLHDPHESVLVSPAEMCPDEVTVVADLAGALLPSAWPAAIARFPAAERARRERVLDVLHVLGAGIAEPVAAAAAIALDEPPPVVERVERAAALHRQLAQAAHLAVTASGALARPPQAGRHLYVDLGPLRAGLAARGVSDSMELEEYLTARLGTPVPGGHRFGDELGALRARLPTAPLAGSGPVERQESLNSPAPLELPQVAAALSELGTAFAELG